MDTSDYVLSLLLEDQVEQAQQAVERLSNTLRSMILDGVNVDLSTSSGVYNRIDHIRRHLSEADNIARQLHERRTVELHEAPATIGDCASMSPSGTLCGLAVGHEGKHAPTAKRDTEWA